MNAASIKKRNGIKKSKRKNFVNVRNSLISIPQSMKNRKAKEGISPTTGGGIYNWGSRINSIPLRKASLPLSFGDFVKHTNAIEVARNIIQRNVKPRLAAKALKDEKSLRLQAYEIYTSYMRSGWVNKPPFCCIKAFKSDNLGQLTNECASLRKFFE